jgi:CHAT domain
MTRDQLLNALLKLLPSQLDILLFKLNVPPAYLPGPQATAASRIIEALRWAEQQNRIADVEQYYAEVAGSPAASPSAPAAPPARDVTIHGAVAYRARADVPDAPDAAQPVRVLLVFANPKGTPPLRLGEEWRALRESIRLASARGRVEVEELHAATIDDLRRALRDRAFTIVHFAGHGTAAGLRFEDAVGRLFVPAMAELLGLLRRRGVETVLLNACDSRSAIDLAPMRSRFAIAMEGSAADAGAIEFTRGFYDIIGAGGSVEDAYEEGMSCAALKKCPVRAVLISG